MNLKILFGLMAVHVNVIAMFSKPHFTVNVPCTSTVEVSCTSSDEPYGIWVFAIKSQATGVQRLARVVFNETACNYTLISTTTTSQCECINRTGVMCIISDANTVNIGDQWFCSKSTFLTVSWMDSDVLTLTNQDRHECTTTTLTTQIAEAESTITSNFDNETSTVTTTVEMLSNAANTFSKQFIMIRSASTVPVVIMAASLLIYLYKKYTYLSVHDTSHTNENTNAVVSDVVEENRQSTINIYKSIPISVFSPIADSFPLPQGANILDICADSCSESSIDSVHYYETVREYQNVEKSSLSGAGAVSDANPNKTGVYESLAGKRSNEQSQDTLYASSLRHN